MSGKFIRWNKEEVAYLISNWETSTAKEIAEKVGHTALGVRSKATKLRLPRKARVWTQQDYRYLKAHWQTDSLPSLRAQLNKSPDSVREKAKTLGLGLHPSGWLDADIATAILWERSDGSLSILDGRLGKSVGASKALRRNFPSKNDRGIRWSDRTYRVMVICVERVGQARTAEVFKTAVTTLQQARVRRAEPLWDTSKMVSKKKFVADHGITSSAFDRCVKELGIKLHRPGRTLDISADHQELIEESIARKARIKARRS